MSDKKNYAIAIIGIVEQEQRMLQNTFWLSRSRPKTYALASVTGAKPDLFIVDADNPQALTEWQALAKYHEGKRKVPVVMATRQAKLETEHYSVKRPLLATRVLAVLDQVVTQELESPALIAPVAKTPEASPAENIDEHEQKTIFTPGNKRILVVDDSLPIRKQIELELQLYEVDVDFAETGERAIQFLDTNVYDLVLLDVVLPGVDGYEICKKIKKNKRKRRTPVVMLTSKSSPFDRVKGKLAGCDAYLTKPVQHITFQKVVKTYIG